MDAIWIVVLVAVAIIVVGGIWWYGRQRREQQIEERRVEAQSTREEAAGRIRLDTSSAPASADPAVGEPVSTFVATDRSRVREVQAMFRCYDTRK